MDISLDGTKVGRVIMGLYGKQALLALEGWGCFRGLGRAQVFCAEKGHTCGTAACCCARRCSQLVLGQVPKTVST